MKHFFTSNTFGVQLFMILSLIGSAFGFIFFEITINEIILIIFGYFIYGCLGVVITFHRNLTHQSYKTFNFLEKIFSIFGCLGGTGSPIAWIAIHINHHLNSDKKGDPHSPLYKGLKIFMLNYHNDIDSNTKWKMRNVITNKFQQFLHRYYFGIIILWNIILFLLGGLYLVIFLHWTPALITILMSNVVNYFGHKPMWLGSYRTYNLNDQSANNWLLALLSWGESWHNNHHRFPKKSYFGNTWYEIDIAGLIIKLINKNAKA